VPIYILSLYIPLCPTTFLYISPRKGRMPSPLNPLMPPPQLGLPPHAVVSLPPNVRRDYQAVSEIQQNRKKEAMTLPRNVEPSNPSLQRPRKVRVVVYGQNGFQFPVSELQQQTKKEAKILPHTEESSSPSLQRPCR